MIEIINVETLWLFSQCQHQFIGCIADYEIAVFAIRTLRVVEGLLLLVAGELKTPSALPWSASMK